MTASRTASVVATAVALVAVAAPTARAGTDWTTFGFDAQRTGFNPQEKTLGAGNVDKLKEAWTADLGGPSLTEPTVATGVLQGGRDLVYVGTLKGDRRFLGEVRQVRGEVRAGRSGRPGAPRTPRAGCGSRGSGAGCR